MNFTILFVFAIGCSSPPAPDKVRQGFSVTTQSCSYDLTLPAALSGSIPTYADRGVDCLPPEGGEAFTVGFGWDRGVLHLVAPRPVSGSISLSTAGLYLRTDAGWCVDWDGYAVIDDLPHWSVFIDATCKDNGLRVLGQLEGR